MAGVMALTTAASAWSPSLTTNNGNTQRQAMQLTRLHQAKQAGTFFNQVPENNDEGSGDDDETKDTFEMEAMELLRQRKGPSRASQPSTINGKPTAGQGFGARAGKNVIQPAGGSKPFVGIGPQLNDPTKPEYDDQGYTLYADEKTGKKSRVFEALVDYPCKFTMKIVGAQEGNFVQEMVAVVAESCQVKAETVDHSVRTQGKWVSVTVKAPVSSDHGVVTFCCI